MAQIGSHVASDAQSIDYNTPVYDDIRRVQTLTTLTIDFGAAPGPLVRNNITMPAIVKIGALILTVSTFHSANSTNPYSYPLCEDHLTPVHVHGNS